MLSAIGTCGFGQWISSRSTAGRSSSFRLLSSERAKSSAFRLLSRTLVVRKISSRCTPDALIASPDLALVAVERRGVDVAIAVADRGLDRLRAGVFLQPHRAEADDGNARAVRLDEFHFLLSTRCAAAL